PDRLGIGTKSSDLRRGAEADDEITRRDIESHGEKITWLETAEIIGVCDRTMRRMRERYRDLGHDGLFALRRRARLLGATTRFLRTPSTDAPLLPPFSFAFRHLNSFRATAQQGFVSRLHSQRDSGLQTYRASPSIGARVNWRRNGIACSPEGVAGSAQRRDSG